MISRYKEKIYTYPPCWGLVTDVYINELGFECKAYMPESQDVKASAKAMRLALHNAEHGLVKINAAEDYCVVLMGKTNKLGLHHCGVYYKGKVLHALPTGNVYQDMASLMDAYKLIEFWAIKNKE